MKKGKRSSRKQGEKGQERKGRNEKFAGKI